MPAPGDQHKSNGNATHNPFEEIKPTISVYTAQEIATLQSRLNRRLGPEYISTRAGPGNSRVAYLSAEKAINLANEVFGFNGWSSSIQNIQIDFVDENPTKGTISIGLSVVVRVTLKDGTYHEDVGYGGIDNCKSKMLAFEKAKKEGTTDALKRALRSFGNVLGNCIYDKEYITKVSKIKAGQGKWDVNELYRHADWVPKKEEETPRALNGTPQAINDGPSREPQPSLIPEESFDVNEFDEADFDDIGGDDITLPLDTGIQQRAGQGQPHQQQFQQPGRPPPPHGQMMPSKPPQFRADQNQHIQNTNSLSRPQAQQNTDSAASMSRQPPHLPQNSNTTNPNDNNHDTSSHSSLPGIPPQHFSAFTNHPQPPPLPHLQNQPHQSPATDPPVPIGFYSARAVTELDITNNSSVPTPIPKFNPYAESPSIRKTSGVDHSKSAALKRDNLKEMTPAEREREREMLARQKAELEAKAAAKSGASAANVNAVMARPGSGTGFSTAAGGSTTPSRPSLTSAYRPPTRHGGPVGGVNSPAAAVAAAAAPAISANGLTAAKRAPLGEISNISHGSGATGGAEAGGDVKRQRIGPGLSGNANVQNANGGQQQ